MGRRKYFFNPLKKLALFLLLLQIFAGPALSPAVAAQEAPQRQSQLFLPMMTATAKSVILGVYTRSYLGESSTIANEVQAIDSWSGKRLSIVGTYIALEDPYEEYNITVPLGNIWNNGYTPFVNLDTSHSLSKINSGGLDKEIREMARAFRLWRSQGNGQDRRAFVAPLQEMNGDWVPYYGRPADFKHAFRRIQDLFDSEQASSAVRWVFAPNGWGAAFEDYYPGDQAVEAVALSAYNAGFCPKYDWKEWETPEQVFGPYVSRMAQMAPRKPIFVAQTATTAYTKNGYNESAKSQWLIDGYSFLAQAPNVFGIIYFNRDKECDWAFFQKDGRKVEGYRQVVSRSDFKYVSPVELAGRTLTR